MVLTAVQLAELLTGETEQRGRAVRAMQTMLASATAAVEEGERRLATRRLDIDILTAAIALLETLKRGKK